jgi:hypothetical protein
MATVAVPFTHFDLTCKKGDELPDDCELVELAPHLFVQPATSAIKTKKERP